MKRFVPSVNTKYTLVCFVCGISDHLNYACSCKNPNAKGPNIKCIVKITNTKWSSIDNYMNKIHVFVCHFISFPWIISLGIISFFLYYNLSDFLKYDQAG